MTDGGARPEVDAEVAVTVDDRQHRPIDAGHLSRLLAESLRDQGVAAPAEVGLSFVDVAEMTDLNVAHMGGTGPTDVLAFPIDGAAAAPEGQPAIVGDVVICPEVAERADQPLADELALLVVHGALHLVGHDHAEPQETAVMKAAEQRLLSMLHEVGS